MFPVAALRTVLYISRSSLQIADAAITDVVDKAALVQQLIDERLVATDCKFIENQTPGCY